MNAGIYRIIFNETLRIWVAVSELTKARGKRSSGATRSGGLGAESNSQTGNTTHVAQAGTTQLNLRPILSPIALACVLAFGATGNLLGLNDVQAQIVADKRALGANQPTVLPAGNGVPIVNITTPNSDGVSRNVYIQFDVSGRGVVMNNGRAMSQTELAGWVAANPWLIRGGARVILNEVNSSSPTNINGYIEIAGQKADIVIANPSGINVNGAGFINAGKATLTTGTPTVEAGGGIRLAVSGGAVTLIGDGLDARRVSYTEILARAVNVNAGIWTQELSVQGGAQTTHAFTGEGNALNVANAADPSKQPTTVSAADAATRPQFAIDVGSLGGMYAGSIRLVGTERGVGVRNAGEIGASAGQIKITADGKVVNTGLIVTSAPAPASTTTTASTAPTPPANNTAQDISIQGASIANSGSISSLNNLNLSAVGSQADANSGLAAISPSITNSGLITAQRELTLRTQNIATPSDTGSISNTGGTINAKRIDLDTGTLSNSNTVKADGTTQIGKIQQTGEQDLSVQAQTLTQSNSAVLGALPVSTAGTGSTGTTGTGGTGTSSTTTATPTAPPTTSSGGGSAGVSTTTATGTTGTPTTPTASTTPAETLATGSIKVASLNNDGGQITASGATDVQTSQTLSNESKASINVRQLSATGAALNNNGAASINASSVNSQAASFNNAGGTIVSTTGITVNASSSAADAINNQSGLLSANQAVNLTATQGGINTQAGTINTTQTVNLNTAQGINNQGGSIQAAGNVLLSSGAAVNNNQGLIASSNAVQITAQTLSNDNTLSVPSNATVSSTTTPTPVPTPQTLGIQAKTIDVNAQSISSQQGVMIAGTTLNLNATGNNPNTSTVAINLNQGQHSAGGDVTLRSAGGVNNAGGTLASNANVSVIAANGGVANQGGSIQAIGTVQITATSNIDNSNALSTANPTGAGGSINAGQTLSLNTTQGNIHNAGGQINAKGDVTLSTVSASHQGSVDNTGGLIASSNTVTISTTAIDNQRTRATDWSKGIQGKTIVLETDILNNRSGALISNADLSINTPQAINNQGGAVITGGNLSMTAAAIDNGKDSVSNLGGLLQAKNALNLSTTADVNNADGQISAGGAASITSSQGNINNTAGSINATGNVTLTANSSALNQGSVNNSAGLIASGNAIQINAQTVSNDNTFNNTAPTLDPATGQSIPVAQTQGVQGQSIQVTSQTVHSHAGYMAAKNSLELKATGSFAQAIHLDQGSHKAGTLLALTSAGGISNVQGALTSAGTLDIDAKGGALNNQGGQLMAQDNLNTTAQHVNNVTGQIASNAAVNLTVTQAGLQNAGGSIKAGQTLTVNAVGTIDNSNASAGANGANSLGIGGVINAKQALTLSSAQGDINNTGGQITATGAVTLTANSPTPSTAGTGHINNSSGLIASSNAVTLTAHTLSNDGTFTAAKNQGIQGQAITANAGTISSQSGLMIASSDLKLTSTATQATGTASTNTSPTTLNLNQGLHSAGGDITLLSAGTVSNNAGTLASGANITLTSTQGGLDNGTLNQISGVVQANQTLTVNTFGTLNNASGKLAAKGNLTLTSQVGEVNNQAGQIRTNADLTVHAGQNAVANGAQQLLNQGGTLSAGGTLTATAAGNIDNSNTNPTGLNPQAQGGIMQAGGALSATSTQGNISNTGGAIKSAGDLTLTATSSAAGAGTLNNSAGAIASNAAVTINAQTLNNDNTKPAAGQNQTLGIQANAINVTAGNISSQSGAMTATTDLTLTATATGANALNLAQGTHSAGGNIALDSQGGINNQAGSVSAKGSVTLTAVGDINNTLTTNAPNANSTGTNPHLGIAANSAVKLISSAGSINNQNGSIGGNDTVTLNANQGINNQSGNVSATGNTTLTTAQGNIDNRAGTVSTNGTLTLNANAGNIHNQGGSLASGGALAITALGNIDNSKLGSPTGLGGSIGSNSTVNVTSLAGSINNAAGSVSAKGNVTLNAQSAASASTPTAGMVNNQGGFIASNAAVTINAQSLSNDNTLSGTAASPSSTQTLGIQASNVTINAANVSNQTGYMVGANNLTIAASQTVNNTGGRLEAGNTLTVRDTAITQANAISQNSGDNNTAKTLAVTNTGGVLTSGAQTTVNARSVTGDGTLESAGNLDVLVTTDFTKTATGKFQANGTASLTTTQDINNAGLWRNAGSLTLNAANINNTATGEISSGGTTTLNTTQNANGQINNRGLIDGVNTVIKTTTLNNTGTGRIYGDKIAIQAGTINNTEETTLVNGVPTVRGATIAARNDLDIGTTTLNNTGTGSLIYAGNDLSIGGALDANHFATGTATTVNNNGATIESGRHMVINAGVVNNLNSGYTFTLQPGTSTRVIEVSSGGGPRMAANTVAITSGADLQHGSGTYCAGNWEDGCTVTPATGWSVPFIVNAAQWRCNLTPQSCTMTTGTGWEVDTYNFKKLLLGSTTYPFDTFAPYYNPAAFTQLFGGNAYVPYPSNGNFSRTHRIWADFGVVPPATDIAPPYSTDNPCSQNPTCNTANPQPYTLTVISQGDNGDVYSYINIAAPTPAQLAQYQAYNVWITDRTTREQQLHNKIQAFYVDLNNRKQGGDFTIYDYNVTTDTPVLTSTNPGKIISGGNMTFNIAGNPSGVGGINNSMSHITAGNTLTVNGGTVKNINVTVDANTTRQGYAYTTYNAGSGIPNLGLRGIDYNPADITTSVTLTGAVERQNTATTSTNTGAGGTRSAGTTTSSGQGTTTSVGTQSGAGTASVNTGNTQTVSGPSGAGTATTETIRSLSAPGRVTTATPLPAGAGTGGAAPTPTATNAPPTLTITPSANGGQVRTASASLRLPNNSLFLVNPASGNSLVETDPRFTNQRNFLSSDYLLNLMGSDPATTTQRLGDGFYEQRLIREQVTAITGMRYLGDYQSDEQQYQALMQQGATYAKSHNLRPGIALSPEQIAQLTSDIVWLVEQEVTLPNGNKTRALVPQVYARIKPEDLSPTGQLLAGVDTSKGGAASITGRNINLNLNNPLGNNTLSNQGGTIAGRQVVSINAQTIDNLNGGRITGQAVGLTAKDDINVIGSTVEARDALIVNAGKNVNVTTTTSSSQSANGKFSQTSIDRVAGLYVGAGSAGVDKDGKPSALASSSPLTQDGILVVNAGKDLNLTAAAIANTSGGASALTALEAKGNVNLGTVTTANKSDITFDARNYRRESSTSEVGTNIQTVGNLSIKAGDGTNPTGNTTDAKGNPIASATGNINARAATISASQGMVALSATNDINLLAGRETSTLDSATYSKSRGLLSSKSSSTTDHIATSNAVGTSVEGAVVSLNAGNNVTIKGSSVVSDQLTAIKAGNDVNILADTNTREETHSSQTKKSGFTSSGLSIGYSANTSTTNANGQSTSTAASMVGSTGGDLIIQAGGTYRQTGSDLLTPKGDIDITAKRVEVTEARETNQSASTTQTKSVGISIGVSNAVVSAAQGVNNMAQAASNTDSSRAKALAGAAAGLTAYNTYQDIAKNPSSATSVSVGITASISKSTSTTSSQSDTAKGSNIAAGGNISIKATGDGANSDIVIQGSKVDAGGNVKLKADDDILLLASKDTTSDKSSNKSSGYNVGVTIDPSKGLGGIAGINVGANKAKGAANSDSTTYNNTSIQAGGTVNIDSGGDTTLKGANIAAAQVIANVGTNAQAVAQGKGNLTIESLQDTSTYNSNQKSTSASLSLSPAGIPTGGSISGSKTNINSNYQSVGTQSGIATGVTQTTTGKDANGNPTTTTTVDGGFQINVAGNTTLTGGKITSTDTAVQNNANSFQTGTGANGGTLTSTDIQNSAAYKAQSASLTVGTGGGGGGVGSKSGNAQSTTQSGITGVATAGMNNGATGNAALRTGDAETGIKPIFDKEKVTKDVQAQVAITQQFGMQASKTIGDEMGKKEKDLKAQADKETDPAKKAELMLEAAKWGEGGTYRVLAHTVVGGLTGGNVQGALGAGVTASSAPLLDEMQAGITQSLVNSGVNPKTAEGIAKALTGATAAGIGYASSGGSAAGTVAAVNGDMNNRQLHENEKQRIKSLSGGDATKQAKLTAAACALISCSAEFAVGSAQYTYWKSIEDLGSRPEFANERALLAQQKDTVGTGANQITTPMFGYGAGAQGVDAFKRFDNTYNVTTRAVGALQTVGGVGTAMVGAGITATGAATCAPTAGGGCLAAVGGAAVTAYGTDQASAGINTVVTGQQQQTIGGQAIANTLGISPQAAELLYGLAGLTPAAVEAAAMNRATNAMANSNALASASYRPFTTQGLQVDAQTIASPQAQSLIKEIQAGTPGMSAERAKEIATTYLESGTALPSTGIAAQGTVLIKVVPAGEAVSANSGFFMSPAQAKAIATMTPEQAGQILGLPAAQAAKIQSGGMDFYAITPKAGSTPNIFVSTVAPTTQGGATATGTAQQVIVPNRSLWTPPKPIDPFKLGN